MSYFNPRAPYGARLVEVLIQRPSVPFQSTRPIRGATSDENHKCGRYFTISIHAPHTGRDLLRSRHSSDKRNFNPRAPYGARQLFPFPWFPVLVFQSTRPIRGATLRHQRRARRGRHFNPRAPYGARLFTNRLLKAGMIYFNPRAPYGARRLWRRGCGSMRAFQSTRPIRGATVSELEERLCPCISIHAPHTGRDVVVLLSGLVCCLFQSTRPIRGATL